MNEFFHLLIELHVEEGITNYAHMLGSGFIFHLLIGLHGEECITNYAHMLGSGHVMEYLHWQNLHYHSQQGWEGTSLIVHCIDYTCTDVHLTFLFPFCIQ